MKFDFILFFVGIISVLLSSFYVIGYVPLCIGTSLRASGNKKTISTVLIVIGAVIVVIWWLVNNISAFVSYSSRGMPA